MIITALSDGKMCKRWLATVARLGGGGGSARNAGSDAFQYNVHKQI